MPTLRMFQSQVRSQSTGDLICEKPEPLPILVSISGEKPIHWRRHIHATCGHALGEFQSQVRSQSTGDLANLSTGMNWYYSFNLR